MCAAWTTDASGRSSWQISSTFPRSTLSVLWTDDRGRDQWIRQGKVTAREQHQPGITTRPRRNVVFRPRLLVLKEMEGRDEGGGPFSTTESTTSSERPARRMPVSWRLPSRVCWLFVG